MARIRTIKPEFPQSESIGRLSRDARLLFIQLWTIADDSGRARAASRMLASLLYPYDTDAGGLVEGWLGELESEGMIRLYTHDGARYLEIIKWLEHQKIDKPSKSRLPEFREGSPNSREDSRGFAEASSTDLGPRTSTKDHDAALPPDENVTAIVFDTGVRFLEITLGDSRKARAIVGKWRKDHGDEAVIAAIGRAQRAGATEPVGYITAVLQDRLKRGQSPPKPAHASSQPG